MVGSGVVAGVDVDAVVTVIGVVLAVEDGFVNTVNGDVNVVLVDVDFIEVVILVVPIVDNTLGPIKLTKV